MNDTNMQTPDPSIDLLQPKPVDPVDAARAELAMTPEEQNIVGYLTTFALILMLRNMSTPPSERQAVFNKTLITYEKQLIEAVRAYRAGGSAVEGAMLN